MYQALGHNTQSRSNDTGQHLYGFIEDLYPICRSISGDGLRQTLKLIGERIPLEIHEIPTGTQVFDWEIPKEWNIKDAYIKNSSGEKILDFHRCNLHVVSYSTPIAQVLSREELVEHIFTLPEHPDWVPYRTTYYHENWGFCMSHNQLQGLPRGSYEVVIDSTLKSGSLTYGDYYLRGDCTDEVIFFCHVCHPSLCNDNLSGVALLTFLAEHLRRRSLRYSYRFVFAPATIGSIAWLSRNEARLHRIKHGLVASVVGDPGDFTYKKSRQGDAEIDRAVLHVLKHSGRDFRVMEFSPYGYDERQFCSPGINLPIGRLTRTPNGCYPEYHTSADDLSLVRPEALDGSYRLYLQVVELLESNLKYVNLSPRGEPQLGRRGLYRKTGGYQDIGQWELAMLWALNFSDGDHSLLDIAERSGLPFSVIRSAASDLSDVGLLAPSGKLDGTAGCAKG